MEMLKEAGKLLESKGKGKKWVEEALPVVVGVAKEIKTIEATKKGETDPLNELIKDIREKYKGALQVLENMDERLRERVMKEYPEGDSIKQDGVGELVFPEVWGWEVVDIKKVDRKYMSVDSKIIMEDIRKGVRKIPGLEIGRKRTLQVRPEKEENNGK